MKVFYKLYRRAFKKSLVAFKLTRGFTLVELAIVLVIIGIILGAILKGQDLINNARIKRTLNDLRGVEAMVWSFYDRYGRFPGDCDKNGRIDAGYLADIAGSDLNNDPAIGFCPAGATADTDPDRPWAELKQAKFLSAEADTRDLIKSSFGFLGLASVTSTTGDTPVNAITLAQVPCYVARAIDIAIDKTEDASRGRIRYFDIGNFQALDTDDPADPPALWVGGTNCVNEDDNTYIVYLFDREF